MRYAEVLGLLISVMIALYSLLRAGRKWVDQQQKDRIDAYYLQLNDFLNQMLEPQTESELLEIEKELQSLRSTALHQLARERLQSDESFRIFQTVLAEAGAQVRHKLQDIRAERISPS